MVLRLLSLFRISKKSVAKIFLEIKPKNEVINIVFCFSIGDGLNNETPPAGSGGLPVRRGRYSF